MNNSRRKLSRVITKEDPKPTNSSRGRGLILETPYHPGFVDDKDLETIKMAVDKELSEISNAFYETTEKTADTITRIDKIEISSGDILARIEEVDRVSKEGDEALSSRITNLTATVGENTTNIKEETVARTNADTALGTRITELSAETSAGVAQLKQEMSVVSDKVGKVEAKWGVEMTVNGKVSGVVMNNDGAKSAFEIIADRFTISDGTSNTIPPFEVVGGHTRIKSAYINTLQSDNWDAAKKVGWAITKNGDAYFNNVEIRGTLQAQDIQGDMGTEWRIATNDLSPNINVWTNLKNFNIINARPYVRQIIWDCGFVTNGNLATAESVFNLRIRHSSGTQIASGLVTVGVDYSLPMRMYGQIPANMAGACVAEVQKITSNGSIHGTDGTIRVFKYTNELS